MAGRDGISRIAFFFRKLAGPGGAERTMYEEALYCRRHGIETALYTFGLDPSALFDPPYPVEVTQLGAIPRKAGLTRRLLAEARNIRLLRRVLRRFVPDVVLCSSGVDCIDVFLATQGLDVPYASHIHGTVFWFDDRFVSSRLRYARLHRPVFDEIRDSVVGHREFVSPEAPPGTWVDRLEAEATARVLHAAIRRARVLFTPSRHMAWEVERLYGRTPIPIKGAVSPALFGYRARRDVKRALGLDGRRVVLNVNRLDPRKRVGLVLRAFALIAPEQADLHLLIGGTGPEEAQLRTLARELGVAQRVKFLGYIPEDELPDYLVACDVFVHPNWADFAISPYEALALGRKVVWSSEMEVDDDLRRGDNLFVAAPTVEDMTAAIRLALATPSRAPADLSNYTWDVYAGRVLEALQRAVGGAG